MTSTSPLSPRPRRQSSQRGPPQEDDNTIGTANNIPFAPASPTGAKAMSYSPVPMPATDPDGRKSLDPLDEFSQAPSNLLAVERCLAAACSLLRFEIAEVWTYAGGLDATEGKAVEPMCLHVYVSPATIESFKGHLHGPWTDDSNVARHEISPMLVDQARKGEGPLWYTSKHPDTPLHSHLKLNTAVALPISLDIFHRDLCYVFFAIADVNRHDSVVNVLTQLAKAAGVALSSDFPAYMKDGSKESSTDITGSARRRDTSKAEPEPVQQVEEPLNVNVRWDELNDVEFMVNGSRCTIYTAFYKTIPVVVKLVRRDTNEKDLVRQELELEVGLLMRLKHPNIVRLIGAGNLPEKFLLIERLDGGTLAQRCGNALNIRDRRRRFRHKRPFTYEELLRQSIQLAEALEYMHNDAIPGKLVIHRDLKPDNIAFDSDGNLKLIDLGLGRVVSKSQNDDAVYDLTGETGSLRYMAPEVALRRPYNGSADVYGFAMILWEMARMVKPFESIGREDFLRDVVRGGQRPHLSKNWPPQFASLIASCWHADPKKRLDLKNIIDTLTNLEKVARESAEQARSVQKGSRMKLGRFKSSKKGKGTFR